MFRSLVILFLLAPVAGCVERTLTIRSNPPGALVSVNGEPDIGRTPFTHDFTWYGDYDITLRKEGYQTLKTKGKLIAPLWQWVPIDFAAEILPLHLHDERVLTYSLKPASTQPVDPDRLMMRAEDMRDRLESTHRPTTRPK